MTPTRREAIEAGGLLIGRLLLAALFLLEGWSKLRGYDAAVGYMNHFGVPGALLPAIIALEVGAAVSIAVGWYTRISAVALAVFAILAAVLFHANLADRSQLLHFEKDLAIAGGLLVLAVAGAGRWAIEARA